MSVEHPAVVADPAASPGRNFRGLVDEPSLRPDPAQVDWQHQAPLVRTGELDRMAPRRLVETAAWWLDVTTAGSLELGGKGIESTLRVRLTHAHVRRCMHRTPDWDYEAWDSPVNQIQMAGTHLLFSVACMGGLRRLGVHYDERERASIMHLWRYVGRLMGVDDALLPTTEGDTWRLFWLMAG